MNPTKVFQRKLKVLRSELRARLEEGQKCAFRGCSNAADHVVFVGEGALMWEHDAPILFDSTPFACTSCVRSFLLDQDERLRPVPIAWVLDGRELFRKVTRIEVAARHICQAECQ